MLVWLSYSVHINAGQIFLKKRFPNAAGLHNVDLARTLSFIQSEPSFVQILNMYDSHWVCVTTIGWLQVKHGEVYNSMRTGDVCISTKECIAVLVNCQSKFDYL